MVRPAFLSAAGIAWAGAMGKSMGAHAASAKATRGEGDSVNNEGDGNGGRGRTDDLGEGLEAKLGDLLLRRENDGTRAVVEVARVGGGDGSGLDEDGAEGGDLGGQDLLVLLVLDDNGVSLAGVGDGDGSDLALEGSGGPGNGSLAVRLEGEFVLVLAGDLVLAGRLLSAAQGGEGSAGSNLCLRREQL